MNLRLHGAASGGKTTTEASSLVLFLSNVMGSWLNGKSDHAKDAKEKKGGTDMNNIFYIVGVIVVVLFFAGYFGLR